MVIKLSFYFLLKYFNLVYGSAMKKYKTNMINDNHRKYLLVFWRNFFVLT